MSVTKELREHVAQTKDSGACSSGEAEALIAIADVIDAEHKRRMERSRIDTRKATLKYLRAVMHDYGRDVKRVTRRMAASYVDRYGRSYCSHCDAELDVGQVFCSACGAKIKHKKVV